MTDREALHICAILLFISVTLLVFVVAGWVIYDALVESQFKTLESIHELQNSLHELQGGLTQSIHGLQNDFNQNIHELRSDIREIGKDGREIRCELRDDRNICKDTIREDLIREKSSK